MDEQSEDVTQNPKLADFLGKREKKMKKSSTMTKSPSLDKVDDELEGNVNIKKSQKAKHKSANLNEDSVISPRISKPKHKSSGYEDSVISPRATLKKKSKKTESESSPDTDSEKVKKVKKKKKKEVSNSESAANNETENIKPKPSPAIPDRRLHKTSGDKHLPKMSTLEGQSVERAYHLDKDDSITVFRNPLNENSPTTEEAESFTFDQGTNISHFNILILGCGNTGKTNLILRWVYYTFAEEKDETLEENHCKLMFSSDGTSSLIQIKDSPNWPTNSDEHSEATRNEILENGIQWAHGFILVFDLTTVATFSAVDEITKFIKEKKDTRGVDDILFPQILIGTHLDLCPDQRRVNKEEATAFMQDNKMLGYFEVSSLNGDTVEDAVQVLLKQIGTNHKEYPQLSIPFEKPNNDQESNTEATDNLESTTESHISSDKRVAPPVPPRTRSVQSMTISSPVVELPDVLNLTILDKSIRLDQRCRIVQEILTTERSYLHSIEFVITSYLIPLRIQANSPQPILKAEDIPKVFSNLDEIYQENLALLTKLENTLKNWSPKTSVLSPFLKDFFVKIEPIYMDYACSYRDAILTLYKYNKSPAFLEFISNIKNRSTTAATDVSRKQDLPALLIQPVQRIPRYTLLVNDLLKRTDSSHPDYEGLRGCSVKSESNSKRVDEQMQKEENFMKLCKIQRQFAGQMKHSIISQNRVYIREGTLVKICRKVPKKRFFWLFNDLLIYGAVVGLAIIEKEETMFKEGNTRYHLHRILPIDSHFQVKDNRDKIELKNSFQIMSSLKSFTVYAADAMAKASWMQDLTHLIEQQQKSRANVVLSPIGDSFSSSFNTSNNNANNDGVVIEDQANSASAPIWIPDNEVGKCQMCGTVFTVIKRRHHCRNCGKCICATCSAKKRKINKFVGTKREVVKEVRVCNYCYDFLDLKDKEERDNKDMLIEERESGKEKDEDGMDGIFNVDGGTAKARLSLLKAVIAGVEKDKEEEKVEPIRDSRNRRKTVVHGDEGAEFGGGGYISVGERAKQEKELVELEKEMPGVTKERRGSTMKLLLGKAKRKESYNNLLIAAEEEMNREEEARENGEKGGKDKGEKKNLKKANSTQSMRSEG
eukprot:TRINITY_DN5174_c0_g1_i3.p1 TRINITY_DN5174_c0_g1~~TRINITY_DN5174_c0_g1_i3.p1  ORF type:complete len:1111 (+),score=306.91 TRINITY_DN5174_c0_g1_i3:151-3483(+)